ncbi:type VI secretion-associated protein [Brucella endophytica]|uniref:Type VI secretion-associated protein n=1 Tax=Brucella endophytica TaxID=1963359 RepID=A0A916S8B6_9HYPH|nr:type VI secretion system-associated protein TagF [Brucella endophytica]GGA88252.1 type VI secretion-associated protein [Brucella endophytica]
MTLTGPPHPGFFGKVPTHGDFVASGLSRAVQSALDHWIDEGMKAIHDSDDWETRFQAMPSWRFVVQSPLWGEATVAGILTPSRDRVGRSFPLVIAAQIPGFTGNPQSLCFDRSWFTAAEALGESTRFRDFDLTRFTDGLNRLRMPYAREDEAPAARLDGPRSIWWTFDGESHEADGFMTSGKPDGRDFEKLLPPAKPATPAAPLAQPVLPEPKVVAKEFIFTRAFATHAGTRLSHNADSLLVSSQPDLFAITDGIADDQAAKHAARLATSTLSETGAHESLDDLMRDIKGKLGKANSLLWHASPGGQNGASIAALAFLKGAAAVIWAGDTRCYLIRDGMMRCLTRDHVEIGMKPRLLRFVGADQQFMPDVMTFTVEPKDRFVLCSAGLIRALGERAIADILLEEKLEMAAEALIQEALISNARDNISAIVIDAHEVQA